MLKKVRFELRNRMRTDRLVHHLADEQNVVFSDELFAQGCGLGALIGLIIDMSMIGRIAIGHRKISTIEARTRNSRTLFPCQPLLRRGKSTGKITLTMYSLLASNRR
jgi:hypothetical protein